MSLDDDQLQRLRLRRDPQLEASLRNRFGSSITEYHLKLAETPQGGCSLGLQLPAVWAWTLPGACRAARSC